MLRIASVCAVLALALCRAASASETGPPVPASASRTATIPASAIRDITGSFDTDDHGAKHYHGAVTFVSTRDVMSGSVNTLVVDGAGNLTFTSDAVCILKRAPNGALEDLPREVLRARCRVPEAAKSILYAVNQEPGGTLPSRVTINSDSSGAACARPNVAPSMIRAVEPDMPAEAVRQGLSGDVIVVVSLDAASHIVGTRVQRSDNALLTEAALAAAHQSTYRTRIRDCIPVPSEYLFAVTFVAR